MTQRPRPLVLGFVPWLLGVAVCVMASGAWIWQSGTREQVELLRQERFRFSLNHTKAALESGLQLGNSTADLPGAQALIAQVRDRQPDIFSIDIYDALGKVVISTDPGGVGLKLPAAWAPVCLKLGNEPWSTTDAEGGVQCVGLVNPFGQIAGSVLIRHRLTEPISAVTAGSADRMGFIAGVVFVVMALGLMATGVARPLERHTRRLQLQLRKPGSTEGQPPTGPAVVFGPEAIAMAAVAEQSAWLSSADAEADVLDAQELI